MVTDVEHNGAIGVEEGCRAASDSTTDYYDCTTTNNNIDNHCYRGREHAIKRCILCLKVVLVILFFLYLSILAILTGVLPFPSGGSRFRTRTIARASTRIYSQNLNNVVCSHHWDARARPTEEVTQEPPKLVRVYIVTKSWNRLNFQSAILAGGGAGGDHSYLVHYYTPRSPVADRVRKVLHKFAARGQHAAGGLRSGDIVIAEVNCLEQPYLCRQQSVVSFPTLRLYGNGGLQGSFERPKVELEALEEFIRHARNSNKTNDDDFGRLRLNSDNLDTILRPRSGGGGGNANVAVVFAPESCHRWCADLASAWRREHQRDGPREVYRVQCANNPDLCRDAGIAAQDEFPDLRWYHHQQQPYGGDWIVPRYTHSLVSPPTMVAEAHAEVRLDVYKDDVSLTEEDYIPEKEYPKDEQDNADPKVIMNQVRHLKVDTFDEFVGTHKHVFVLFYVPWCIGFMPIWIRLSQELTTSLPSVQVVAVNCVDEVNLCHNVNEYPTTRLYRGSKGADYSMYRTFPALSAHATNRMKAPSPNRATPAMEEK